LQREGAPPLSRSLRPSLPCACRRGGDLDFNQYRDWKRCYACEIVPRVIFRLGLPSEFLNSKLLLLRRSHRLRVVRVDHLLAVEQFG
jgi:hypothetical protein